MENYFKSKGLVVLLFTGLFSSLTSCDKENEEMIIDYAPVIFEFDVVNSAGDNLLDETTKGNILDSDMYIEIEGEKYDVNYGWPMEPLMPYYLQTRAYLPAWYGAFIAPYWYPYPGQPDRDNRLYVGEFPGDARGEVKFELYLDGHSYIVSYINKKINGLDVDRRYYLDGKEIKSSHITLTL